MTSGVGWGLAPSSISGVVYCGSQYWSLLLLAVFSLNVWLCDTHSLLNDFPCLITFLHLLSSPVLGSKFSIVEIHFASKPPFLRFLLWSAHTNCLGSYIVILTPKVTVLGSGTFRRWLKTEDFMKEAHKAGLPLPQCEDTGRQCRL